MRARLIVESGVASPRVCELDASAVVLLGRNRENTIVLQDPHASRTHARVYARDDRFYIGHLKTTNGTRLDGESLESDTPLEDGQVISIGEVRLRFAVLPDEPLDLLTPPVREADDSTLFQADELTALFRFMNDSLGQATPHRLVGLALGAALR